MEPKSNVQIVGKLQLFLLSLQQANLFTAGNVYQNTFLSVLIVKSILLTKIRNKHGPEEGLTGNS